MGCRLSSLQRRAVINQRQKPNNENRAQSFLYLAFCLDWSTLSSAFPEQKRLQARKEIEWQWQYEILLQSLGPPTDLMGSIFWRHRVWRPKRSLLKCQVIKFIIQKIPKETCGVFYILGENFSLSLSFKCTVCWKHTAVKLSVVWKAQIK